MGLRLVKKTVNQDDPTVYHLFYADEAGSPGADLTFFEYPGAGRGSPGVGMVHRVVWRVASEEALTFWEERLLADGIESQRSPGRLEFNDPEGLGLALTVSTVADQPLIAEHPEIPGELALQGFDGVRAYSFDPDRSRGLLQETLGFAPVAGASFEARGEQRGGFYVYDEAPGRGIPGAGTVHHVAWASPMDDHDATIGPGFATDEDRAHLGESLSLPPAFEHLRAQLDGILTPLPNPRRDLVKDVSR
jgi:glyoxalase family protein